MRRFLVVLLTVLLVTLMMAKVKVTFWHAMGGGHGKTLQEIVDFFNQQRPDIEVEAVYIGNYAALQQKLLASVLQLDGEAHLLWDRRSSQQLRQRSEDRSVQGRVGRHLGADEVELHLGR
jgi:hypothetical protein